MKAYLIDPVQRTVEEVAFNDSRDYHQIHELIGADCYDVARINREGDGIFVDDEGLLRSGILPAFQTTLYGGPLAGRGLCLGCDPEGETREPQITLEALRDSITFGQIDSHGCPPWTFVKL